MLTHIENKMTSFDNTEIAFRHKSTKELKNALSLFSLLGNNLLTVSGKLFTQFALKLNLPIQSLVKKTIFKQFVGGETIEECEKVVNQLYKEGIGTILDYSIEGQTTDKEFDLTTNEIIKVILLSKNNPKIPFAVFKPTGVGSFSLYEKLNDPDNELSNFEKEAFLKVNQRIDKICRTAYEANTPVFIDAEESWIQNTIDRIAMAMMAKYNKEKVIVYNTIQLYRHDRLEFFKQSLRDAQKSGFKLGVKLVRGAYMEKERERAIKMNFPSPIQPNKKTTDDDYNKALKFAFDNIEHLAICNASHNEDSAMIMINLIEKHQLSKSDERVYFAQLYGMSDHISYNLSNAGYNVCKYVPYGPVSKVLPYLIRRADENSSVSGQSNRELNLIKSELKRRKKL